MSEIDNLLDLATRLRAYARDSALPFYTSRMNTVASELETMATLRARLRGGIAASDDAHDIAS